MDFGLDKCAKCTIQAGKKVESENIELNDGTQITDLQQDSTYKYLGIEENSSIEHKLMRKKIQDEYVRRLKKICKSQLTSKNKVTAINQLAVPVVSYGFGIVDWHHKHLNALRYQNKENPNIPQDDIQKPGPRQNISAKIRRRHGSCGNKWSI